MKGVPNRKHGQTVDRDALFAILEAKENWLWENGETASLAELQQEVISFEFVDDFLLILVISSTI